MPILRQNFQAWKLDSLLLLSCVQNDACLLVLLDHTMCVCNYHQNVKLMLNTANTSLSYKDVLKLCVCSTGNSDCMLHHYDLCPEQTVVCSFLKEQLLLNYMISDLITYKQWVSTDWSSLEEHDDGFDDFLDNFIFLSW